MSVLQRIADALSAHATLFVLAFVAVVVVAQRSVAQGQAKNRGVRFFVGVAVVHVVAVVVGGVFAGVVVEAGVIARLGFAWALVLGVAHLLFEVVLPLVRVRPNRIYEDLSVAGAIAVVTAIVMKRAGLDITSLVATSAVITAVIGLSLQDTLGNTIGGLALQLDDSIHVGDWVKVGDINGRVAEIRWRFTAIETRNWETVYVPNSRLVKDSVIVVGKRQGAPRQWRRWVYFNVDFRHAPSDVMSTVLDALHSAPIPNVADDPKPNCVLMDLGESTAKYAVRYWLTDVAADDPTDGAVRTRVFFALKRKGIPLALPAHALFITEDNKKRRERKQVEEHQRRVDALAKVEAFAPLADAERDHVADGLVYAPFTKGEVITRQGAEAHWLYLVVRGTVSVRVRGDDGSEVEVAQMNDGEVFGEMSLLTGEPRAASVYAVTDVECWRLDREAFRAVLQERPDVAAPIAALLAERKVGLAGVKDNLDAEARARRMRDEQRDLLQKMRSFFGLT
jgi:small-conductance mechanosensitive channel/CRP-like cAMP-binding protein